MAPRAYWKCESSFTNGVGVPNGTSVDSPTFIAGQVGNAASFDGSNDGGLLYPANVSGQGWEVPGSFTCTGLAWDAVEDGFWVGDYTNSAVKLIDISGALQNTLSVGFQPQGIAVDPDGLHLWVCNYSAQSIRKILKSDGSAVSSISVGWNCNGVTINGSGNLLITREANSTLYEYSTAGSLIGSVTMTIGGTAIMSLGYEGPDGVHWVDSSTLYVVVDGTGSTRDSLLVVNPSTGAASSTVGIMDSPEGVTVKDGSIWISVDDQFHRSTPRGNRIEKWSLSRPSFSFGGWFRSSSMASTVAMLVNGCPLNTNPATAAQGDRRGMGLYGLSGAGSVRLLINDGSSASSAVSKDVTVSLSTWKHIVVTIDGPNQEAKVYVGGVAQGSALSLSGISMSHIFHKCRFGLAHSPDGDVNRFANIQADELFFEQAVLDATTINQYALGFEAFNAAWAVGSNVLVGV